MGMERGESYGTFGGKQNFPQPSAPPIAGAFSGCAPQYPLVPGYPVLENYPGSYQGSGGIKALGIVKALGVIMTLGIVKALGIIRRLSIQARTIRPVFFIATKSHVIIDDFPSVGLVLVGSLFPWYIGAGIFLFVKHDLRERTGLLACTVAAFVLLFVGGVSFHVHIIHR